MRDKIDDLVCDLTKEIFVYRMSAPNPHYSERMRKSAETRRKNCKRRIENIVLNFAVEDGYYPEPKTLSDL